MPTGPKRNRKTPDIEFTNPQKVSFTEWTRGGNLRHAPYLGIRDDKDPRDIVREPVARKTK